MLWSGLTGFFTLKNLGAIAGLFLVAVVAAYAGITPERIAASIPRPSELFPQLG